MRPVPPSTRIRRPHRPTNARSGQAALHRQPETEVRRPGRAKVQNGNRCAISAANHSARISGAIGDVVLMARRSHLKGDHETVHGSQFCRAPCACSCVRHPRYRLFSWTRYQGRAGSRGGKTVFVRNRETSRLARAGVVETSFPPAPGGPVGGRAVGRRRLRAASPWAS